MVSDAMPCILAPKYPLVLYLLPMYRLKTRSKEPVGCIFNYTQPPSLDGMRTRIGEESPPFGNVSVQGRCVLPTGEDTCL